MSRRSEALPREARLTNRTDFESVKKEGKWIRGDSFDLIAAANRYERMRLGIIVPLYSHSVAERNRLKRRVREVMRRLVLPRAAGSYDIVVKARRSAYALDYGGIREVITCLAGNLEGNRSHHE